MYPGACKLQVGMNAPGMPTYYLLAFICEYVFMDVRWVKKNQGGCSSATHIFALCFKKIVCIGEERKKKKKRKGKGNLGAHAQICFCQLG